MKNEIKVSLQPVQTKRASEEIYDQIKQLILSGAICPGERLPSERKMMDMMHRSRPTIREAMRMLEREGYIKIQSGSSGAIVQEINVDNAVQSLETIMQMKQLKVENIIEFRYMTETVAAQLAAQRRTMDDLHKMQEILLKAELGIADDEVFIDCDLQFHLAVAAASKNPMYVIMLQVCRNMLGEMLKEVLSKGNEEQCLARYHNIVEAHCQVYQAIEEQKAETAYQMMNNHLRDAEQDILKM